MNTPPTFEQITAEIDRIKSMGALEIYDLWTKAPPGHPYFDLQLPYWPHLKRRLEERGIGCLEIGPSRADVKIHYPASTPEERQKVPVGNRPSNSNHRRVDVTCVFYDGPNPRTIQISAPISQDGSFSFGGILTDTSLEISQYKA